MAKEKLEYELESAKHKLDEQNFQLDLIRQQTIDENMEKARAAYRLRSSIASDREELIKELDTLRKANKKLFDENDVIKTSRSSKSSFERSPQTSKRGSIIGNYLFTNDLVPKITSLTSPDALSEFETDEFEQDRPGTSAHPRRLLRAIEAHVPVPVDNSLLKELELAEKRPSKANFDNNDFANNKAENGGQFKIMTNTPERIYKIVCVGDSGVGKTCFLHRFCHNKFRGTFSATIGVDFQVKSVNVDDKIIALQLWDTAGQERFRSITKQYFRKADGVVLMYDVTSELSFLNMRNWMQSIKEGVEPNCVLCLVGNKADLCSNNEASRVVKYKDGEKLAQEFGALFFETSARSGDSIDECMISLAKLLSDQEDKFLDQVVKLDLNEQQKKKWCCSR